MDTVCKCDDCLLGITDVLSEVTLRNSRDQLKRKPSEWRKVRNVLHWSPFVQTYKKRKYPWIQLAGHQGNFKSGHHGTILKRTCGNEEHCLTKLMNDVLQTFVPEFNGKVEICNGELFLEMQDLLADFEFPCVMDLKMGVRTYLEEELAKAQEKTKLRKDMYEKMIKVDPDEPTEEENKLQAVTKTRYMIWRETISSTSTLGFRIEGIKHADGALNKEFKTTKTREQVVAAIKSFVNGFSYAPAMYLERLESIRSALMVSKFFSEYEFVGSSLLFVHNNCKANIWLIDFAKTQHIPKDLKISHNIPWVMGNHEDGYLIGMDEIIRIFQQLVRETSEAQA